MPAPQPGPQRDTGGPGWASFSEFLGVHTRQRTRLSTGYRWPERTDPVSVVGQQPRLARWAAKQSSALAPSGNAKARAPDRAPPASATLPLLSKTTTPRAGLLPHPDRPHGGGARAVAAAGGARRLLPRRNSPLRPTRDRLKNPRDGRRACLRSYADRAPRLGQPHGRWMRLQTLVWEWRRHWVAPSPPFAFNWSMHQVILRFTC